MMSTGVAARAIALLPGALVVYFSFNAGGYFPEAPALAAIVLAQIMLLRVTLARSPFAGFTPGLTLAVIALGLYALWILASGLWSPLAVARPDRVRSLPEPTSSH